jgi:hypothetical protein
LWATEGVEVATIEDLGATHPAVVEAADVLLRPWA